MDIKDFPLPHIPDKLPATNLMHQLLNDQALLKKIIRNGSRLSEFIGYLQNLPNPEILISSLTLQEAVLSSRIEGTIATIEDVISGNPSSSIIRDDIVEIENYCAAIHYGYKELAETDRGISKRLIKELHILLLNNNVRGAGKNPGEFKTEQNYIINDILGNFTPLPPLLTDEFIDNLIDYIKNNDEITELLQAAIIHAQFEMIHPFKDGNGRVGRLLIPLFLYKKQVIPYPVFYISRYFSDNEDKYKLFLSNISKATTIDQSLQAWADWFNFFFDGVAAESKKHIQTSKGIIDLRKTMISEVNKTDMIPLIDLLFNDLKIEPKKAITALELPPSSVYKELKSLAAKGYITRTGSDRKTTYVFSRLLDIVK